MLRIIGNHISPFVRKVLAVCEIKALPYELDSIVPFFGDDRFGELSPFRRIPVLVDGTAVINDSSVICEYLEEKWPQTPVLPADAVARAAARHLDEIADTKLAEVVLWKVFGRLLIAPAIFGAKRDLAEVEKTLSHELPPLMDVLEKLAPRDGYTLGDRPGLADISVASHFANFQWARQTLDAARWPYAVAWIARTAQAAPLLHLNEIGEKMLRVPPDKHAPVLAELGVRIAQESVGGAAPRRGPMTVI